jgi:hypothetical protein
LDTRDGLIGEWSMTQLVSVADGANYCAANLLCSLSSFGGTRFVFWSRKTLHEGQLSSSGLNVKLLLLSATGARDAFARQT